MGLGSWGKERNVIDERRFRKGKRKEERAGPGESVGQSEHRGYRSPGHLGSALVGSVGRGGGIRVEVVELCDDSQCVLEIRCRFP
jgi:hypothetical protein